MNTSTPQQPASAAAAPGSLQLLADAVVVAVIRAPDERSAVRGVEALLAGGVTGIEITYSTPNAAAVIKELADRFGSELALGAGTVLSPTQAEEAVAAGAQFLVCPGHSAELAAAMLATGATVLLGALTPTEVMRAVELGAHAVKVFPASVGGPSYLRALRGPFPDVAFVPTGGVNVDNIGDWLAAGAVAVGAGGDLCSPADLAAGRWSELTERAQRFHAAARAGRTA